MGFINRPPQFAIRMLKIVLKQDDFLERSGDLEEVYSCMVDEVGPFRAQGWYWFQVLKAVPVFVLNSICWRGIMLKSYFKIAMRNIKKHKGYAFINIAGLAVGFACSILIALFVFHELRYDRFHEHADRIYRIVMPDEVSTPAPLARTLAMEYPEVEYGTCFANMRIQPVKYQDRVFYESPILGTTHECFEIFTFPLIMGNKENVLKEPNTVVITQSMANKYFRDEDPLHKVITIGDNDYRIDGVMEDVPDNAHFHFKCLVSNNSFNWYTRGQWGNNFMTSYLLLRNPSDRKLLESKLPDFITKYLYGGDPNHSFRYVIQPLTSIHLHSDLRFELEPNGDIKNVIIFSTAAVFMIVIACINFMNLTTAKSVVRIREIGIRKTVGSTRTQLIHQFLGESTLMSLFALILGVILVFLILPVFHRLIGRQIGLEGINLWMTLPGLVGFAILIGMLAGSYPAFYLSSFRPVNVMRGMLAKGKTSSGFRNGMVVFQFVVSIMLIIGTLTVYRQLDFIQNKDLGFDKDQVLIIQNLNPDPLKSETLKQRLMRHTDIVSVSSSGNLPGKGNGRNWLVTEDADTLLLNMYFCDFDYQKTLQLEMAEGRFFSRAFGTDTAAIILNEHVVNAYNIEDPVGKRVTFYYGRPISMTVIGVVKDFHYQSLHQQIRSLGMIYGIDKGWGINYISIRLNTNDMAGTIEFIKGTWESVNPVLPFDYAFLDDEYHSLYANEQSTGRIALVFCILAIGISCLGLFGLSMFVIERRIKEIGIRKVLGASVKGTVWLLSRSFMRWILFAFFLAVPLAWFIMTQWLQNFAYRVDLDAWVFILSGLMAFLIAFITVSVRALKAAITNPVESLRYE